MIVEKNEGGKSMNKKKVVACLLAATMATGMLAGCGGSSGSSDSSSSSSGGKDKLTFWFPTFASADGEVTDEEFWNEKMDAFEEENNCEVNVEIIPWDNYEEKYLTGVNSNDGPDVGYLYMEMFYVEYDSICSLFYLPIIGTKHTIHLPSL